MTAIKTLVFSGGEIHDFKGCGEAIRDILAADGRFKVTYIEDDLDKLVDPGLDGYDIIVFYLSQGAPEGKRFVMIQAGADREAHLVQPCPEIKSGGHYGVSIRFCDGPVLIKAYEYGSGGGGPKSIRLIATAKATDGNGDWAAIEGTHYPLQVAKTSIVVAVAAGCTADVDDFRVWQIPDARGCSRSTSTAGTS